MKLGVIIFYNNPLPPSSPNTITNMTQENVIRNNASQAPGA
jgi:hypothetical protein